MLQQLSTNLAVLEHLAHTALEEDNHRVIAATLRPPANWRRPVGCLRTTWLRTIDDDHQSLNFRVHTAWRKARNRDVWHQVVSMAIWSLPIKKNLDMQLRLKTVKSFR